MIRGRRHATPVPRHLLPLSPWILAFPSLRRVALLSAFFSPRRSHEWEKKRRRAPERKKSGPGALCARANYRWAAGASSRAVHHATAPGAGAPLLCVRPAHEFFSELGTAASLAAVTRHRIFVISRLPCAREIGQRARTCIKRRSVIAPRGLFVHLRHPFSPLFFSLFISTRLPFHFIKSTHATEARLPFERAVVRRPVDLLARAFKRDDSEESAFFVGRDFPAFSGTLQFGTRNESISRSRAMQIVAKTQIDWLSSLMCGRPVVFSGIERMMDCYDDRKKNC